MAEEQVQEFRSSSWDDNYASNYKLEMILGNSGINYGIVNQLNSPVYLRLIPNTDKLPVEEQLKKLAETDEMLKHKYDQLEVIVSTDPWLAVPNGYLTRGKEDVYMQVMFETNTAKDGVIRDELRDPDLSVLFCVGDEVKDTCKNTWPDRRRINYTHVVSPVLQMSHKIHTALKGKPSANVEVFSDSFIYTIFENNKLRFCNRYKVSGAADILYFIMNVNQTLDIAPDRMIVFATGSGELRPQIEKLLEDQFKHYVTSRKLFPASTHLNEAGFFLDQFSFLLVK